MLAEKLVEDRGGEIGGPSLTYDEETLSVLAGRRVCIVTSAPVCCNPRVVKEADALAAAGCEVRVVASQHVTWVAEWDAELMRGRRWTLDAVRWDGVGLKSKYVRLASGARQRLFRTLAKATSARNGFAELAYGRLFVELKRRAQAVPADLYIAHNPPALPAACAAAKKKGVPVAFDSEDFHTGEFAGDEQGTLAARLLSHVESVYLPRCHYVTAPSDAIAEALVARYGIRRPVAVHNVFPWADRGAIDGEVRDRRGGEVSLYWYSQVVGLDRGLQDAIRAAGLLRGRVQLHVRGKLVADVITELSRLASECGVAERVFFHPPVPPGELLSRTAEHDIGLALEQPVNESRTLTVTNKLFFYMLAELALAATETEGQRAILSACPDAGFLYRPGDYEALAAGLQGLIDSPARLRRSKEASLRAARGRWNWETESRRFVSLVASVWGGNRQTGV